MARKNQIHDTLYTHDDSFISSRTNNNSPNCYIIFYSMFYKKILDKEFPNLSPQKMAMKTGEMWNFLPNDLKNSFIEFANTERLLKNYSQPKQMVQRLVENPQHNSELRIIFDDRCVHSNENSNEIPSDYDRIFDKYIDKDAYI
ncbi:hypothetical protein RhiirA4_415658 [Rhizophagus irregularis]|uniref:HMG box domain-containing protein n=1 Tax=Rhizophagus irregularis TaxID=588596 RepID=A0A2I1G0M3_9GLOM|nr:hypothetical protein RhiirA4_415658 [Rhizophagus irregularis]